MVRALRSVLLAESILALVRELTKIDTVCLSLLIDGCVYLKQTCGDMAEDCSVAAPGFCYWSLVPEQPQVIVIEDTLLDAR